VAAGLAAGSLGVRSLGARSGADMMDLLKDSQVREFARAWHEMGAGGW